MKYYLKRVRSFFNVVFFPDREELEEMWEDERKLKSNFIKRYAYYTIEELMIVNPATGCYEAHAMPKPFSIPGRIGWRALHIWQTKIAKTHI